MLTRIACSFAGAMCATAFGLLPAPGLAQTAAPTADPLHNPARNHGWSAPDFSDIDIANSPERLIAIPVAASVKVTPQSLRDLNSVEEFVSIG